MNRRAAFGERLRRHRERRGISLKTVSQHTKVGATLFAALEGGDCSRWPGGVYNRAYVRGYATAVGLDPDEVAAEFRECYGAPLDRAVAHEPLRLSLEDDQREWTRQVVSRSFVALLDLALAVGLASLVTLGFKVDFWVVLSAAALLYYGLVAPLLGATPASKIVRRNGRCRPAPFDAEGTAEEAPLPDPVRGTA